MEEKAVATFVPNTGVSHKGFCMKIDMNRIVIPKELGTKLKSHALLAVVTVLFGSLSLTGSTLTYSGTMPNSNALFEVRITLNSTQNLTIQTQGVGAPPVGNFNPILWLFNSDGTVQIDKNDPPANQNALITETNFGAGIYNVILSVFDQHWCTANTLCNGVVYVNTGWSYKGDIGSHSPNFTVQITGSDITDNSKSCSTTPSNCIIPNPPQAFPASVPEPTSAGLLLIGAGLFGWRKFRHCRCAP
jgi:hypothetical protein